MSTLKTIATGAGVLCQALIYVGALLLIFVATKFIAVFLAHTLIGIAVLFLIGFVILAWMIGWYCE